MGEKQERETEPQGAHNDKEHRVEKKASLADLGQLLKEDMNKNLCFTSRKGALAQHFLHAGTSSNTLNSLLSLSLFGSLMSVFDVETNTISKREGVCVCVCPLLRARVTSLRWVHAGCWFHIHHFVQQVHLDGSRVTTARDNTQLLTHTHTDTHTRISPRPAPPPLIQTSRTI